MSAMYASLYQRAPEKRVRICTSRSAAYSNLPVWNLVNMQCRASVNKQLSTMQTIVQAVEHSLPWDKGFSRKM